MANMRLQANEVVIMKSSPVLHGNLRGTFTDELVLTNLNIHMVKYGAYEKLGDILVFPLNKIKMYQGVPQAILGVNQRSGIAELQIIFEDGGYESFSFGAAGKKEVQRWIKGIRKTVAENSYVANYNHQSNEMASLQGQNQNNKNTNQSTQSVTIKCIGCKAPMSGVQGQKIVCKYCDTEQAV